ncbi:MAG: hypothetical protein LDL31_09135, partial [Prosthecobacter sp.]|nr:hypothetical protein [Prosthecobacter sp.]
MSTLPSSPSAPAPSPSWLQEWHQHQEWQQELHEELPSTTPAQPTGLRLLPTRAVPALSAKNLSQPPPVQVGQVRLLAPLPITGAQDPRPVLVLQPSLETPGRWTCAPFSPLSEPAHTGE